MAHEDKPEEDHATTLAEAYRAGRDDGWTLSNIADELIHQGDDPLVREIERRWKEDMRRRLRGLAKTEEGQEDGSTTP